MKKVLITKKILIILSALVILGSIISCATAEPSPSLVILDNSQVTATFDGQRGTVTLRGTDITVTGFANVEAIDGITISGTLSVSPPRGYEVVFGTSANAARSTNISNPTGSGSRTIEFAMTARGNVDTPIPATGTTPATNVNTNESLTYNVTIEFSAGEPVSVSLTNPGGLTDGTTNAVRLNEPASLILAAAGSSTNDNVDVRGCAFYVPEFEIKGVIDPDAYTLTSIDPNPNPNPNPNPDPDPAFNTYAEVDDYYDASTTTPYPQGYQLMRTRDGTTETATEILEFTVNIQACVQSFSVEDPDGTGTDNTPGAVDNPWLITTAEELQEIAYLINRETNKFTHSYYVLSNDIDLAGFGGAQGFVPIGTTTENTNDIASGILTGKVKLLTNKSPDKDRGFKGVFDCAGKTISNLTINRPDTSLVGLFGILSGAEGVVPGDGSKDRTIVRNCRLENVNIRGRSHVGGLVGMPAPNLGATTDESGPIMISNVFVSGTIRGTSSFVGGLVGFYGGTRNFMVVDAGVAADVSSDGTGTSRTANDVHGEEVGGLVGGVVESDFTNVFFRGSVAGTKGSVGGLFGSADITTGDRISVKNAYVRGNLTCSDNVVGFLWAWSGAGNTFNITNVYIAAPISLSNSTTGLTHGGVLGAGATNHLTSFSDSSNNYWEIQEDPVPSDTGEPRNISNYPGEPPAINGGVLVVDTNNITNFDDHIGFIAFNDLQTHDGPDGTVEIVQTDGTVETVGTYTGWDDAVWDFGTGLEYPSFKKETDFPFTRSTEP